MVLQRLHGGGIDWSFRAVAACVPAARSAVVALAADRGVCEQDLERIKLAVSEAASNAVLHGYASREPGELVVTAATMDDELTVVVADQGNGLAAVSPNAGLGLGLALIAHACDSLSIVARSPVGTQVEMGFRLSRPCDGGRLLAAEPHSSGRRGSVASAT